MIKKILVVDDEKDIGFLMRAMLSSSGYQVLYASNLTDARKILLKEELQIIFLDLNLGNEYGLTLIPTIKQTNYEAKVVVITAEKEVEIEVEDSSNGIRRIIEKPFNKKEILTVLQNCA